MKYVIAVSSLILLAMVDVSQAQDPNQQTPPFGQPQTSQGMDMSTLSMMMMMMNRKNDNDSNMMPIMMMMMMMGNQLPMQDNMDAHEVIACLMTIMDMVRTRPGLMKSSLSMSLLLLSTLAVHLIFFIDK